MGKINDLRNKTWSRGLGWLRPKVCIETEWTNLVGCWEICADYVILKQPKKLLDKIRVA